MSDSALLMGISLLFPLQRYLLRQLRLLRVLNNNKSLHGNKTFHSHEFVNVQIQDQLIVTISTLSIFTSVHNQLSRTLFEAHIVKLSILNY